MPSSSATSEWDDLEPWPEAIPTAELLEALEVLRMTDHLTDELVATALSTAQRVRFPVSRLVLDPERFAMDAVMTGSFY
jgi:hypothetical protein